MRTPPRRAAALLLAAFSLAAASGREDTARLAARLMAARAKMLLSAAESQSIQAALLEWIDARMKAGDTVQSMNRELSAAGLLATWPDTLDQMLLKHAGYLEGIKSKPVQGAGDVLALEAGVYQGPGCSKDVTAVLYQRKPALRLGYLNAEPGNPKWAYYLSGLAVGERDSSGQRLVASGWVISNCTSTWNGKRIRIDRVGGASPENLLARDLDAQDREGQDSVSAWVRPDGVTFWYRGGLGDPLLMVAPAVVRYRIVGGQAERAAPAALTRAGFIREWLSMTDGEAAGWSDPDAAEAHKSIHFPTSAGPVDWLGAAECGGRAPAWEVAVKVDELKKEFVFRIAGDRATELRMLAVGSGYTDGCTPVDIFKDPGSLSGELPW